MPASHDSSRGSLLLAEEYFRAEDDRFVDALCEVDSPKPLAGFTDRWKIDPRPWARAQVFAYLQQPLAAIGHNVVVKRLFKQAEARQDHELMAAFLVAFDRLVRRQRRKRWHYDWQTRESWSEEYLASPRDTLPLEPFHVYRHPRTGKEIRYPAHVPQGGRLFSLKTRYYLRRRAWRYFRRLGFQRPDDYVSAIAAALKAYPDEALEKGEHLLDSWGLMQACFRHHDTLEFGSVQVRLKPGGSLADLSPAPRFPDHWRQPEALSVLLDLVTGAASRLVRTWAMQLLRREHAERIAGLPSEQILRLLEHDDDQVQQFGAEVLEGCSDLAKLPIRTWLQLLETRNPTALDVVCRLLQEHVTAERLELADCIRLATAEPAPVAHAGLEFLKARRIVSAEDREAIASVSAARCAAWAGALTAWALGHVGSTEHYDRDQVLRFLDARLEPVRQNAWMWLIQDGSAGRDDPGLWCRLLETPYDDIRLRLVDELSRRAYLPGAGPDDLTPVWSAVLLGVHRGGRQKQKALRQVAAAIDRDLSQADPLLPVLVLAARSIRDPESRAGLAAIVGLVESHPELKAAVAELMPELEWQVPEAAS